MNDTSWIEVYRIDKVEIHHKHYSDEFYFESEHKIFSNIHDYLISNDASSKIRTYLG